MNAQTKTDATEWAMPAPAPASMKVYAAISKVMGAVGKAGISKDKRNAQQGYNFRGIDDVYNALSPFLAEAQLCILPRVLKREVTERVTQKGGTLFYVVLEVAFDLVSAEDGSRHTVVVAGEAMDSGDKATNKAMSAAYKYACMEVFCIPTEGDNDADGTTHDVAAPPVPEDCWTALTDAAKQGEVELRRVWKESISAPTREIITKGHTERWEKIKAVAAAVKVQS